MLPSFIFTFRLACCLLWQSTSGASSADSVPLLVRISRHESMDTTFLRCIAPDGDPTIQLGPRLYLVSHLSQFSLPNLPPCCSTSLRASKRMPYPSCWTRYGSFLRRLKTALWVE